MKEEIRKVIFTCSVVPLLIRKGHNLALSHFETEPPDFPRSLRVVEKGSRYINISWMTSQDGNSPITQYIIEYKTDTGEYFK